MCLKTGNGKNYLAVNPSSGFLDAKSKSCAGNAVFSVDYFTLNKNAPPRIGPPIVIRAANGKYVRFYGRTLRAVAPRIRPNDRFYMFSARPSHGGIRGGAVMAPGMRVNLYPMMARFQLMTATQKGGGSRVLNLRRATPRHPVFF